MSVSSKLSLEFHQPTLQALPTKFLPKIIKFGFVTGYQALSRSDIS